MPQKRSRSKSLTRNSTARRRLFPRRRRRRSSFATKVKKIVLRTSETKYKGCDLTWMTDPATGDNYTTLQQAQRRMTNNSCTLVRLWDTSTSSITGIWPSQGDTDSNREGDRIMCTGFMIRGLFSVHPQFQGLRVKMFYVPYNDGQGNPNDMSAFFHNVSTTSGTVASWPVSPHQAKRWPGARYLGTITSKHFSPAIDAAGNTKSSVVIFKKWVPLKKSVTFLHDAATQPSNMPQKGVLLFFAYASTEWSRTTTIADSFDVNATLYWKDV